MTTTYNTDPNTQTVASAWASSPLGQPDYEVGHGFATEPVAELAPQAQKSRPIGKHAVIAAALAGGIGTGAALGLLLLDFGPDQEAVVVPGTAPAPAVVITPNVPAPQTLAPNPVTPGGQRGPAEITVPRNTVTVETPPPAAPPAPQQPADTDEQPQQPQDEQPQPPEDSQPEDPQEPQDPEPPQPPEPPVVVDDLTQPEAEPDPEPPVDVPDLPLVLAP
jgi:hypothetical protein